jgi:hypothetical protein
MRKFKSDILEHGDAGSVEDDHEAFTEGCRAFIILTAISWLIIGVAAAGVWKLFHA